MNDVRSVRIEVDLSAIRHNYTLAKSLTGSKAFAVVKSNAYGHGAVRVAAALNQADGFAVVTTNEAVQLRESGIHQPILVLQGPQHPSELEFYCANNLMPVLHHVEQIEWYQASVLTSQLAPWLKIDTGMGRLGVSLDEAERLLDNHDYSWFGALTHFATADSPGNNHTHSQINRFKSLVRSRSLQLSLANSAGILAWPESHSGWVRPGLMLYGANPLDVEPPNGVSLQPAMRVTAPLIAMKNFKAGAGIGYAQTYVCKAPQSVGFLAVGYGDGFPRVLNASASVRISGQICSIIGRVSMDSIAIDLTPLQGLSVKVGDSAILWGPEHPVDILAAAAGTISYELFTGIRGNPHYLE